MKQVCWLLGLMVFLTGCSSENRELSAAMSFREKMLSAQGCAFSVEVTADYGDSIHSFSMDCQGDSSGKLSFELTKPETIAGIKGTISDTGGNIVFEDQSLYFPLLTDDLLTPASAPWIFLKTLRSGYIISACTEDEFLHMTIDDSYEEDAMTLDIWLEGEDKPVRADILHDGKRILSLDVENFVLL